LAFVKNKQEKCQSRILQLAEIPGKYNAPSGIFCRLFFAAFLERIAFRGSCLSGGSVLLSKESMQKEEVCSWPKTFARKILLVL
jgi:hypothetical protein